MLYDKLAEYGKKGVTPMHMPGHKRNTDLLGDKLPYDIDITEIDGFDDLHDAHGVLKGYTLYIPGFINSIFRFAGSFIPKTIIARLIYARWSGAQEQWLKV